MVLEIEIKCFNCMPCPGENLQTSEPIQDSSQLSIRTSTSFSVGKNLMITIQVSKHVTDSLQDNSFQIEYFLMCLVGLHAFNVVPKPE